MGAAIPEQTHRTARTSVKTLPEHLKEAVVISLPVASYENRPPPWLRGSRGPEGRSPR